jgi:Trk K+ transport system NAD-binding subunit
MPDVFVIFFRRMRAPLLVLIATYSVSILGLVAIPGVDPQGNVWHFDFFHAFYFVSFMASTIGFGEIPYAFTPLQRMWTAFTIYLAVIGWLYAIGTILSLVQDPLFRRALQERRFLARVRALREPFFIVCGCGESGRLLVKELARRDIRSVAVDADYGALQDLELEDLPFEVPHLLGDASDPKELTSAGLTRSNCRCVIALTSDDRLNLKIAITTKLMNRHLRAVSTARDPDTMANLASFNTDHIINPFYLFADHLARALHAPNSHLIYRWLVQTPGRPLREVKMPPRGTWILCGYGRFGKAVARYLRYEGISTVVIEPDVGGSGAPEGSIAGRGTEAVTLREARIHKAVGIVAGTDDDANNLSILMTARDLNPNLYFVARENHLRNNPLFLAAHVDFIMQSSRIVVGHIVSMIITPLMDRFLRQARHHDEEWAGELLKRLREVGDGVTPETWSVGINEEESPAVVISFSEGLKVTVDTLQRDPTERRRVLPTLALMLLRDDDEILLPEGHTELRPGDHILFSGRAGQKQRMKWAQRNQQVLHYLITGEERAEGAIWRHFFPNRKGAKTGPAG